MLSQLHTLQNIRCVTKPAAEAILRTTKEENSRSLFKEKEQRSQVYTNQ